MQKHVQVKSHRVDDKAVESRSLIGDLIKRRGHCSRVDYSHGFYETLEFFDRLDLLVHLHRTGSFLPNEMNRLVGGHSMRVHEIARDEETRPAETRMTMNRYLKSSLKPY